MGIIAFARWFVFRLAYGGAIMGVIRTRGIIMSDNIVTISDSSFDADVIKSDLPVLVDFWAEWCGPCRMIAPLLDELAEEYAGKVKVCKMNVDENAEVPAKFGVRGIPTLLLFVNGEIKAQQVGAVSKNQLLEFVDANVWLALHLTCSKQ